MYQSGTENMSRRVRLQCELDEGLSEEQKTFAYNLSVMLNQTLGKTYRAWCRSRTEARIEATSEAGSKTSVNSRSWFGRLVNFFMSCTKSSDDFERKEKVIEDVTDEDEHTEAKAVLQILEDLLDDSSRFIYGNRVTSLDTAVFFTVHPLLQAKDGTDFPIKQHIEDNCPKLVRLVKRCGEQRGDDESEVQGTTVPAVDKMEAAENTVGAHEMEEFGNPTITTLITDIF